MEGIDRFILEHEIARGGQGSVWLAEDKLFRRKVAIKLLHADATTDAAFLRHLLNEEAALQAALSPEYQPHPNIVFIIDVRPFGEEIGIVMEYVDGGSLAQAMGPRARRVLFSPAQMTTVVVQVCEGLAAAHDKQIIHRDIKPGNILLFRQNGAVKITDWGVAKNIDIAGRGRTFLGTPPYMSPEVLALNAKNRQDKIRADGVDHRTDLYSLGVMMFEMLTGRLPFDGDNEIRRGVQAAHLKALADRNVSEELSAVIVRSMAREPGDRFQTARELQSSLRAPAAGDQIARAWEAWRANAGAAAVEALFREALAHGESPQVLLEFARFYIQCSREDEALKLVSQGIRRYPGFAPLWNARGRLLSSHNTAAAVADLEKALALGLPDREARQNKAMLARIKRQKPDDGKDLPWKEMQR
jgi:serine/threonine-protein kinase